MASRFVRAGILAGLIGGILFAAFTIAVFVVFDAGPIGTALVYTFQLDAAGAIGKATAFSSPAFAWLGAAIHFAISIAWASGFAYLAQTRQQLLTRPLVSGLAFGFVVWFITQLALIAAGLFQNPSPSGLLSQLESYCVFFGLPVSYTVARVAR